MNLILNQFMTDTEQLEYHKLRKQLFASNTFVIFSSTEEKSDEMIRYQELLTKMLKYRRHMHETVVQGVNSPCYC